MINLIACISKNRGIGYQGQLLFHLDTDLKLFKAVTMHNIVVMGRKTYDSLYTRPLPNRHNVVLSSVMTLASDFDQTIVKSGDFDPVKEHQRHGSMQHNHALGDPPETKITYFANFDDLDQFIDAHIEEDIWIIGGQSLYEHYIGRADKIILTEVDAEPKADAFFPMLDCEDYAIIKLKEGTEQGYHYVINVYQRLVPWGGPKEYNKPIIPPCK